MHPRKRISKFSEWEYPQRLQLFMPCWHTLLPACCLNSMSLATFQKKRSLLLLIKKPQQTLLLLPPAPTLNLQAMCRDVLVKFSASCITLGCSLDLNEMLDFLSFCVTLTGQAEVTVELKWWMTYKTMTWNWYFVILQCIPCHFFLT